MSVSLDIKVKKANKVYRDGETISGVVVVKSPSDFKHDGIVLTVEGSVGLTLSSKTVGVFEALYNSAKPIQVLFIELELAAPGKMPSGTTQIPFEAPLRPKPNRSLYETYHGVFINVQYNLRCELKRSHFNILSKDLQKINEFIIENKAIPIETVSQVPVKFSITPESLTNARDKYNIPRFRISGHLDSTECSVVRPFTGEIVIEQTELPIKSVELQLVRVETCGCAEGYSRDATEIQNIQIGEGNVFTGIPIPIYMVFPRLFTCPTLITSNFKIEFEVNLVIIFQDDHLITENFPITLLRC
uniref:Vacuolar protein sorting-associated protein 26C n=1 Tax=Cacopsylla melanoneura TaxID=428564 RepID=A0A8D9A9J7_9HEMI